MAHMHKAACTHPHGGTQRGGGGQGCRRRGVWLVPPPPSQRPPMVPAEGGPNILKRTSSGHRRPRGDILADSLKHWKGRMEGGGSGGGYPPFPYVRCTAVLIHHCPRGHSGRGGAESEHAVLSHTDPGNAISTGHGGCEAEGYRPPHPQRSRADLVEPPQSFAQVEGGWGAGPGTQKSKSLCTKNSGN